MVFGGILANQLLVKIDIITRVVVSRRNDDDDNDDEEEEEELTRSNKNLFEGFNRDRFGRKFLFWAGESLQPSIKSIELLHIKHYTSTDRNESIDDHEHGFNDKSV